MADLLGVTTSTVSQQIGALGRAVGTPVIEPDGRRVRLTPPGRRLAEHAGAVLAALESARAALDPAADPRGTVRVASFATGIRRSLLPVIRTLRTTHPDVNLQVLELEPPEALAAIAADEVDLALTYDYTLARAASDEMLDSHPLWQARWRLAVPSDLAEDLVDDTGSSVEVLAAVADQGWIVNSRHTADEDVLRTVSALAGFEPRVTHRADSLDLVRDLVAAGLGVGLVPEALPDVPGVIGVPLHDPEVLLRCFAMVRRGRGTWPPLAAVLELLLAGTRPG
ncbi:LysR family transcriptional regulator [Marmoricola endophyticus]|uniref:LysR family transcriptional regulator n=1 Tax=Marmoricola endophyticus TaxID=2040280 RepID=A0A917BDK8_9ACTN|nr:LysR family transcriptional regulator [Marmoricola endophyticus]